MVNTKFKAYAGAFPLCSGQSNGSHDHINDLARIFNFAVTQRVNGFYIMQLGLSTLHQ